jgi:NADPH:quinone reductase-like Zn-dependent oxidoreductase
LDRCNTLIAFQRAAEVGITAKGSLNLGEFGRTRRGTMQTLIDHVAKGELEAPIAATYPLDEVKAAFEDLERRRTRGKIVLVP